MVTWLSTVASDQERARGAFRVFALVVESKIEARQKTDMTGPSRTSMYVIFCRTKGSGATVSCSVPRGFLPGYNGVSMLPDCICEHEGR